MELIIKITALGPGGYVKDPMNDFDGIIVLFSVIDMMSSSMVDISAFRSLRILRTLRVFRVTKLLRSLAFMSVIVQVLSGCLINFVNICNFRFILEFSQFITLTNDSGAYDDFYLYFHFAWI
jgi:hypothetical protein